MEGNEAVVIPNAEGKNDTIYHRFCWRWRLK
jgi:hypothetical protein